MRHCNGGIAITDWVANDNENENPKMDDDESCR
jgi:hypothetical protein